jgi:Transposase IS116/IS110/IS902 family
VRHSAPELVRVRLKESVTPQAGHGRPGLRRGLGLAGLRRGLRDLPVPGGEAHLCAVAPIPASSGKRTRHRLNRGGDRQANHALWRIVITRMSSHPPTRAYVDRRTAEGLSKKEIIRCLKRYVAREVYPQLRGSAS